MQKVITSGTLKSKKHSWLSSRLNTIYINLTTVDIDHHRFNEIINPLRKLEFIPLLDGTYTSLSKGVIWLDIDKTAFHGFEKLYSYLYSNLRIVDNKLLNSNVSFTENVTEMLVKLGVKRFSLKDFLELVILEILCDKTKTMVETREVMIECLLFVCENQRENIMLWLRKFGFVWTSDGCKCLGDVKIHFGKGHKNVNGSDMKWYKLDVGYLDHPVVKSSPDGKMKLRKFFEKLGVTDFAKIVKKDIEKRENVRKYKTLDYDSQELKCNGEQITEESPASTTPLVISEEDEALKDQSGSGICTQFSETKNGFKGESDHGKGIVSSYVNAGFSSINGEIDQLSLGTVTTQHVNGVKGSGQSSDIVVKGKDNISEEEAAKIIEGIRREEFGMDPAFSAMEERFVKNNNARLGRLLHSVSVDMYSQDSHFLLELIQNADDNVYACDVEPTLTFILQETGVIVLNNEQGFSVENIKALCNVAGSTKKSAKYIGKKGIGFKSVFRVTDAPEIHSNGFHIKFDIRESEIGSVLPTIVPPCDINMYSKMVSVNGDPMDEKDWNTCIMLPCKSKKNDFSVEKLHPSVLLFLHQLKCIKFRNLLDDSLIVMRKQTVGNGIVNVSTGKDNLAWFVESCKLESSHIREDVETTEISVALAIEYDSSNGIYIPKLDQQWVFAFLPVRDYGLIFIVQADFELLSSRQDVHEDSPWNKFLLSEIPNLFVSAEQSFCSLPCFKENPAKGVSVFMSVVPLVGEVLGFFSPLPLDRDYI